MRGLVALLLLAAAPARAGQTLESAAVARVPGSVSATQPMTAADAGGAALAPAWSPQAQADALAPLAAAAAGAPAAAQALRRPGEWDMQAYRGAVDAARAELDALYLGPGPAASAEPETLLDRLRHPFARRPSAEWAASRWVEKTAAGWRLLVPGGAPVAVARWSAEGNPVVRLRPEGGGVRFMPTQSDTPGHRKYQAYNSGDRMTRLTRRRPIRAFYDPSASPAILGITDGHHRFRLAEKTRQAVYVELTAVRRASGLERREGRWDLNPIF